MAAYKVVAVDENNRPQAGVNIYAVSLNSYPTIGDVIQADLNGEAFFSGLVGPHFFWAQEIRTSTTVGERVYSGRLHVQVVSFGNAPCYDYVVSPDGMGTHTTIQSAITAMVALGTGVGASVFICPGTYNEQVTGTPPINANWDVHGAGSGRVNWAATANGQTLWNLGTLASGARIHVEDIHFNLGTFTGCTGLTAANGFGTVSRCHFTTGGSTTSTGITLNNTLILTVEKCGFTGSGNGYKAVSTAQATNFVGCHFSCAVGMNVTGNRVNVTGSTFNCSTMDIILGANCFEFNISGGNEFNKGISTTAGGQVDNFTFTGNTMRLGSGEIGLDFSSITVNSDGFEISGNTFAGAGTAIGIKLDVQMITGMIGPNTFTGFTSGNEISGTGGGVTGAHNVSDAGAIADFGSPVGHIVGSTTGITPRYNAYLTSGNLDSWLEGAQITPSAGTLTLGTDGDAFHVAAGNFSAIATPTRQVLVLLIFDGASVLTHGANLILQDATNFTSAAGDSMLLFWEGSTVWREVNRYTAADGLTAHIADATDAHDASAISILDTAGDFTATNAEDAFIELQAADVALFAGLANHIGDTADAHDASAISILDAAGDFTATDVEGALAEIQADNEAHVAAADPHAGYRLESVALKISHIAEFVGSAEDAAVETLLPLPGVCVGESGEHGTFAGLRGKAICGTAGTGTNTIVIEADDNPAFSSATTLFTLNLGTSTEVDDTTLDNAWASGDNFIRARMTAVGATAPKNLAVFFYFSEEVF